MVVVQPYEIFLPLEFPALVLWIEVPSKHKGITSQMKSYISHVESLKAAFQKQFQHLFAKGVKSPIEEEFKLEKLLHSIDAPHEADTFADWSSDLYSKFSKSETQPPLFTIADLPKLMKYNMTETDQKEEEFDFSYIWVDCLSRYINKFCELAGINGNLGSFGMPNDSRTFWLKLTKNLGNIHKRTFFVLQEA